MTIGRGWFREMFERGKLHVSSPGWIIVPPKPQVRNPFVERALESLGLDKPIEVPDPLMANMELSPVTGLWAPSGPSVEDYIVWLAPSWRTPWYAAIAGVADEETAAPPRPAEPEFEVNMVEPLVGWRSWEIHDGPYDRLYSINTMTDWPPDAPLVALCKLSSTPQSRPLHRHQEDVPEAHCTCGIYAADERDDIANGDIVGEVYGWGRYVRGNDGWRAQYAYPKAFHLGRDATPRTLDILRQYHVPIYMDVPTLFYNPEEDGYEHRNDEADGDRGAGQVADAPQGQDARTNYNEEDY
jgi:hypothetical protein